MTNCGKLVIKFETRGTDRLCSRLSFQGSLCSEQHWQVEIVSACEAKGRFADSLGSYRWCLAPGQEASMLTA